MIKNITVKTSQDRIYLYYLLGRGRKILHHAQGQTGVVHRGDLVLQLRVTVNMGISIDSIESLLEKLSKYVEAVLDFAVEQLDALGELVNLEDLLGNVQSDQAAVLFAAQLLKVVHASEVVRIASVVQRNTQLEVHLCFGLGAVLRKNGVSVNGLSGLVDDLLVGHFPEHLLQLCG